MSLAMKFVGGFLLSGMAAVCRKEQPVLSLFCAAAAVYMAAESFMGGRCLKGFSSDLFGGTNACQVCPHISLYECLRLGYVTGCPRVASVLLFGASAFFAVMGVIGFLCPQWAESELKKRGQW